MKKAFFAIALLFAGGPVLAGAEFIVDFNVAGLVDEAGVAYETLELDMELYGRNVSVNGRLTDAEGAYDAVYGSCALDVDAAAGSTDLSCGLSSSRVSYALVLSVSDGGGIGGVMSPVSYAGGVGQLTLRNFASPPAGLEFFLNLNVTDLADEAGVAYETLEMDLELYGRNVSANGRLTNVGGTYEVAFGSCAIDTDTATGSTNLNCGLSSRHVSFEVNLSVSDEDGIGGTMVAATNAPGGTGQGQLTLADFGSSPAGIEYFMDFNVTDLVDESGVMIGSLEMDLEAYENFISVNGRLADIEGGYDVVYGSCAIDVIGSLPELDCLLVSGAVVFEVGIPLVGGNPGVIYSDRAGAGAGVLTLRDSDFMVSAPPGGNQNNAGSLPAANCRNGQFVRNPETVPGLVADCEVLVMVANQLISASAHSISGNHRLLKWGTSSALLVKDWPGVTVSGQRVTEVRLSDFNHDTRASFGHGKLVGEIPRELADLANLQRLDLWGNELDGGIPPELGKLASLRSLQLGNNRLVGEIPPELGNLDNLTALNLRINRLTGEIPPELGKLASLGSLLLSENRISGEIPPELGDLASLGSLWLGDNRLVGEIPPELGNLTLLRLLRLDRNQLTGAIPPEFGNLTSLERLDLRGNQLGGGIPDALLAICNGDNVICEFGHTFADTDSDGVLDVDDAFHNDPNRTTDSDGDGIDDDSDPFPRDSAIGDLRMFEGNLITMAVDGHLTEESLDFNAYTNRLYNFFLDAFDFIMIVSHVEDRLDNNVYTYYGVASPVSNDVSGVGLSEHYNNAPGSAGKLKRFFHFPYLEGIENGPGLHEVMHTWANFVLPSVSGSHWGFSSVNGQLGGFNSANLVDLGNGRYSAGDFGTVANGGNGVPYSPLELYLAGFIPAREVPDIQYFEDGEWLMETDDRGYPIFTGSPQTITIEEIIAQHGERIPAWTESQKNFRAATILIYNESNPPGYDQLRAVSDQVAFFSKPAPDSSRLYNFYEATRGLGTLKMDDLTDLHRQSETLPRIATPLPDSHGVPPQPVHDHELR